MFDVPRDYNFCVMCYESVKWNNLGGRTTKNSSCKARQGGAAHTYISVNILVTTHSNFKKLSIFSSMALVTWDWSKGVLCFACCTPHSISQFSFLILISEYLALNEVALTPLYRPLDV